MWEFIKDSGYIKEKPLIRLSDEWKNINYKERVILLQE
jgi:hypothetical protein